MIAAEFPYCHTVKIPLVEYDSETNTYKVNEASKKSLRVAQVPVATSFMVFDEYVFYKILILPVSHFFHSFYLRSDVIITDPNADEENLASTQVTIAVCDGEICLMHKPGGSVLAAGQLELCLIQAMNREKSIKTLMDSVLK